MRFAAIILGLLAGSLATGAQVTWELQSLPMTHPAFSGYLKLVDDPVSGNVFLCGEPQASTSIYCTSDWYYAPGSNAWTNGNHGYNSNADACTADKSNKPGDRHPLGQMTVDTLRSVLWMAGGLNQTCDTFSVDTSGTTVTRIGANQFNSSWVGEQVTINSITYTVASVASGDQLTLMTSAGTQSSVALVLLNSIVGVRDTYTLSLNASIVSNSWTKKNPTHTLPSAVGASFAYIPGLDCIFSFGGGSYNSAYALYCPTDLNPIPGTLTAAQSTAGGLADDWSVFTTTGQQCLDRVYPCGIQYPGVFWDAATARVIIYAGQTTGTTGVCGAPSVPYCNETWAYDPTTQTFSEKCQSPCSPPPVFAGSGSSTAQPAMDSVASGRFLFHQFSNTDAPADWLYNSATDLWYLLTSSGSGPNVKQATLAFNSATGKVVSWSQEESGGNPAVWIATLGNLDIPTTSLSGNLTISGKVSIK